MGRLVHIEVHAQDPERAAGFLVCKADVDDVDSEASAT